jgi:hypothetical protein
LLWLLEPLFPPADALPLPELDALLEPDFSDEPEPLLLVDELVLLDSDSLEPDFSDEPEPLLLMDELDLSDEPESSLLAEELDLSDEPESSLLEDELIFSDSLEALTVASAGREINKPEARHSLSKVLGVFMLSGLIVVSVKNRFIAKC